MTAGCGRKYVTESKVASTAGETRRLIKRCRWPVWSTQYQNDGEHWRATYFKRSRKSDDVVAKLEHISDRLDHRAKLMNNMGQMGFEAVDTLRRVLTASASTQDLTRKYYATRILWSIDKRLVLKECDQLLQLADQDQVKAFPAKCGILMARFQYYLSEKDVEDRLDDLAAEFVAESGFAKEPDRAFGAAQSLFRFLFQRGRFTVPSQYLVEHTFLNKVLESRIGHPCILILIYGAVASKLGQTVAIYPTKRCAADSLTCKMLTDVN
jgi:hypothetical protein